VIQELTVQGPLPVGGSASQGVSIPVSKRPAKKIRTGKKTSTAPPFSSLAASATTRR
jgi:hypothetical protein